jgi:hypothetical protein
MHDTHKDKLKMRKNSAAATLARTVAPEDVQPGDFVTVLYEVVEVPSFLWQSDTALLPASEPVRIRFLAPRGGIPFKVKSVCLPFVLVKYPSGRRRILDMRQYRLARLERRFAKSAWKALKTGKAKAAKK